MQLNEQIAKPIHEEILRRIAQTEQEHDVKVLFAVESGSRAWGFASPNSDYDVRFIYVHKQDWYLSVNLEDHRDVIEYPIVDEIDISGWDLRKALKLFSKSNPAFIEWLNSPIVYVNDHHFAPKAKALMAEVISSRKGIYHYLHMAKGNFKDSLKKERVPLKKYFYILRPLLAIMWIEKYDQPPPVEFATLRTLIAKEYALDSAISALLARKKVSLEKEYISAVPVIIEFIEHELARLDSFKANYQPQDVDFNVLNQLFRDCIIKK